MIVKEIKDEELLTVAEVKQILNELVEERSERGEELEYELRKAVNHSEIFAKMSPEKARELVNNLLELDKMKPEIAIRIADITPMSRDELRALYAKERYTLTEEELDTILDLVTDSLE
ncbi:RNA polymerase Rpb4 family protein [Methanosalsum natronophilum]|uniref:DNA-directed RNA polymerase subunit Rpo4 n=1 Tax=Methanosalsum natronophilum TaxID=768733 RepID=A0A424YYP5_9EURY|nr:RNA polymerase Rpb4 family protein [Methanosalsum natronophilum]MCS3924516.1 DNA-directed RNA polymerase subunit F [Methanosalsum natronophilum]RQD86014.1 MAG: RNA polymerase Rpb4 family protein [Methanosalsum natronophilum]